MRIMCPVCKGYKTVSTKGRKSCPADTGREWNRDSAYRSPTSYPPDRIAFPLSIHLCYMTIHMKGKEGLKRRTAESEPDSAAMSTL